MHIFFCHSSSTTAATYSCYYPDPKMFLEYSKLCIFLTALLVCTLHKPVSCKRQVVVLDVEKDIFRQWEVVGDFVYIPTGYQLPDFQNKFPSEFAFKSVSQAKGVWIVFPSLNPITDNPNATTWTNTVTFSFSTAAQLLDSVIVIHNSGSSGGQGSEIKVFSPSVNHTFASKGVQASWIAETVPLNGVNRFSIEATTHEPGDFILIDRISAIFIETTTKPRPPKTSTTPATPTNDGHKINVSAGPVILILTYFLFAF